MKAFLRDFATIQSGIFAKTVLVGDVVYLQARHFDEFGNLNRELHPDLKSDSVSEKHLLKPGDILFAAKGTKNFAAVFEAHNPDAVASTSFMVIRVLSKGILPAYLAWYLNGPVAQKFLKGKAIGTSMVSISKAAMLELEVPVPGEQTQKSVLQISGLWAKEKAILQQLQRLKELQIQQSILTAISK